MPAVVHEGLSIAVEVGHDVGADLHLPDGARGLVVLAHGSGSSRFSAKHRAFAETLHARGFGTLQLDLLTPQEELVDADLPTYRFDIPRLGSRMVAATDWVQRRPMLHGLPLGYYGADTGAAAALIAAAERWTVAGAVVSCGGRPDLAAGALPFVKAPTLLVVGHDDDAIVRLNERAMYRMAAAHVELQAVPGAAHLLDEPGVSERVGQLAGDWFDRYLRPC